MKNDTKKTIPEESSENNTKSSKGDDSATDPLQEKLAKLKKEKAKEENELKEKIKGNDIKKIQKELDQAKHEIEQLKKSSMRALADLENFRRRTIEEKSHFAQFANAELILELLPTLDNFKRAVNHLPEDLKKNDWIKGILQIEKQMLDSLKKQGLKEIDALNQTFDPNIHEALLQDKGEKDKIIEILEPGYMLNDKVLKPVKVKVGNGKK